MITFKMLVVIDALDAVDADGLMDAGCCLIPLTLLDVKTCLMLWILGKTRNL
jgi:hypothetical protein